MKAKHTPQLFGLAQVLAVSAPRPESTDPTGTKNAYATRFANQMARCLANGLRADFQGILPTESGGGFESPAIAVRGPKRLDINYSTPQLGLGLGISLKAVHFREAKGSKGYTHNLKRNDEELRVEASGYHERQPFAVMVAIVFLPDDSCLDGNEGGASSFGKWVKYLRPLAGRKNTGDDIARFEGVFIGLYDPLVPDDSSVGTGLAFFDVEEAPPKQGRPKALLDLHGLYSRIRKLFKERNHTDFQWAAESD